MGYDDKACQNCLVDFGNNREVICIRCGNNVPLPELNKDTMICKSCNAIPKLPCITCFKEFDPVLLNKQGNCKNCSIEYCKSCGAAISGENGKRAANAVDGFCGDCVNDQIPGNHRIITPDIGCRSIVSYFRKCRKSSQRNHLLNP